MDLIGKLNTLMKKNNIKNISQLSKMTKIPYTTLKSIFNKDVNDIRLSTSKKLCDFFNITLDDLLNNNIELTPKPQNLSYNKIDFDGLDENDIEEINRFIEFIRNKKKTSTDKK